MWATFTELLAQVGSKNAPHWCPFIKHLSAFTESYGYATMHGSKDVKFARGYFGI